MRRLTRVLSQTAHLMCVYTHQFSSSQTHFQDNNKQQQGREGGDESEEEGSGHRVREDVKEEGGLGIDGADPAPRRQVMNYRNEISDKCQASAKNSQNGCISPLHPTQEPNTHTLICVCDGGVASGQQACHRT